MYFSCFKAHPVPTVTRSRSLQLLTLGDPLLANVFAACAGVRWEGEEWSLVEEAARVWVAQLPVSVRLLAPRRGTESWLRVFAVLIPMVEPLAIHGWTGLTNRPGAHDRLIGLEEQDDPAVLTHEVFSTSVEDLDFRGDVHQISKLPWHESAASMWSSPSQSFRSPATNTGLTPS